MQEIVIEYQGIRVKIGTSNGMPMEWAITHIHELIQHQRRVYISLLALNKSSDSQKEIMERWLKWAEQFKDVDPFINVDINPG